MKTFGSSPLENGDDRELFPESTGGGTIDLFVQDIEKMTEVSGTVFRGQGNPVTSSVVINPNPLFEGQGDPERVVPVIKIDPLTDGILEGESVCSHGFPIKRGDRSSIYKNRTLQKWSNLQTTYVHERISDSWDNQIMDRGNGSH